MRSKNGLWSLVLCLGMAFLASCEKEHNDHNEEELITTVSIVLTEQGTANPQTFTFRDADGPGGLAPSKFDSIVINANRSYMASVKFLNESVTPAEDLTLEVKAEGDDHEVFFSSTGVSLTVSNRDLDSKGLPLGLSSTWLAGAPGVGKLKVVLKHKPGAKAANDPVTKGETDVELEFNVRMK